MILDRALNMLEPEDRKLRQRRIARGEAPDGVFTRLKTEPETRGLIFDDGGDILVVIAPELWTVANLPATPINLVDLS